MAASEVSGQEWERLERAERLEVWEAGIAANLRAAANMRRLVYAGLALALALSVAALVVGVVRYNSLESDVREACAGPIGALDLSSFVPVCRAVMPEDLDR